MSDKTKELLDAKNRLRAAIQQKLPHLAMNEHWTVVNRHDIEAVLSHLASLDAEAEKPAPQTDLPELPEGITRKGVYCSIWWDYPMRSSGEALDAMGELLARYRAALTTARQEAQKQQERAEKGLESLEHWRVHVLAVERDNNALQSKLDEAVGLLRDMLWEVECVKKEHTSTQYPAMELKQLLVRAFLSTLKPTPQDAPGKSLCGGTGTRIIGKGNPADPDNDCPGPPACADPCHQERKECDGSGLKDVWYPCTCNQNHGSLWSPCPRCNATGIGPQKKEGE